MQTKQGIIIIRGVPGSGKSSLAQFIASMCDNIVVVEADMYYGFYSSGSYVYNKELVPKAHEWCFSETIDSLNQGKSVIVANTFLYLEHIQPYKKEAVARNIFFSVALADNRYVNEHGVNANLLTKMVDTMQWESFANVIERTRERYGDSRITTEPAFSRSRPDTFVRRPKPNRGV